MITPQKSNLNSLAVCFMLIWLVFIVPGFAIFLLVTSQIDDHALEVILGWTEGCGGLVTLLLQGLNLWCNSPP